MTPYFTDNWKRCIASLLVAVLLVLNVMSAAHAGADNQFDDVGQFDHSSEIIKLSHAGETHDNKSNGTNHSNSHECHHVPCNFVFLSNNLRQGNLFGLGVRFHDSPDQLTGFLITSLERPPKSNL
jgi:hypothetical protein